MLRFRESFRGYNRDDVNAYIEQISFVFSKKEAEYRARIAELENKLNVAAPVISNEHSEDDWNKLTAELEALKAEADSLKAKLADFSSENDNSTEAEKSRLYDSMSAQVGNIIISANSNAEKIISDAKCEAERIKREAEEYAATVRADAEKERTELINRTSSDVTGFAADCTLKYTVIVNEAASSLAEISSSFKNKSEMLKFSLEQKIKELEANANSVNNTDNTSDNV